MLNNTQLRKIRNVLPFLLEKSEFEFTFLNQNRVPIRSENRRETAGYAIRTGFRLQNITFPWMNQLPIGMCKMHFLQEQEKKESQSEPGSD